MGTIIAVIVFAAILIAPLANYQRFEEKDVYHKSYNRELSYFRRKQSRRARENIKRCINKH